MWNVQGMEESFEQRSASSPSQQQQQQRRYTAVIERVPMVPYESNVPRRIDALDAVHALELPRFASFSVVTPHEAHDSHRNAHDELSDDRPHSMDRSMNSYLSTISNASPILRPPRVGKFTCSNTVTDALSSPLITIASGSAWGRSAVSTFGTPTLYQQHLNKSCSYEAPLGILYAAEEVAPTTPLETPLAPHNKNEGRQYTHSISVFRGAHKDNKAHSARVDPDAANEETDSPKAFAQTPPFVHCIEARKDGQPQQWAVINAVNIVVLTHFDQKAARNTIAAGAKRCFFDITGGFEVNDLIDLFHEDCVPSDVLVHCLCLLNRITQRYPKWYEVATELDKQDGGPAEWSITIERHMSKKTDDAATSTNRVCAHSRFFNAKPISDNDDIPTMDVTAFVPKGGITRSNCSRCFLAALMVSCKFQGDSLFTPKSVCDLVNTHREYQIRTSGHTFPRLEPERLSQCEWRMWRELNFTAFVHSDEYDTCLAYLYRRAVEY